jgi:hypothetical protein
MWCISGSCRRPPDQPRCRTVCDGLPTRLGSPWTGLPIARAGAIAAGRQARACSPAGSSPCHLRARRHRFATVNHGHSRSFDLGVLYSRCASARMVRMRSLRSSPQLLPKGGAPSRAGGACEVLLRRVPLCVKDLGRLISRPGRTDRHGWRGMGDCRSSHGGMPIRLGRVGSGPSAVVAKGAT